MKYPLAFEPFLQVGDLVRFTECLSDRQRDVPFWKHKQFGIIIDQMIVENSYIAERREMVPQVVVLWNDGETTNSSENCFEVINESR